MCYAIPGRLVELDGKTGTVDYFGEKRKVLISFQKVKVGDYVYAQGGILIDKIPEKKALEILGFWKDEFFGLKKVDQGLAKVAGGKPSENILKILQKVNLKKELSREEIITLLRLKDKNELELLYWAANNIRLKEHGNACCVHGIIEFSNYCRNNCFYCGIRNDRKIKRYRMSVDEIIDAAKYAVEELGFKAFVLQSGEDMWYSKDKLIKIVKEIRKLRVLIFLSIGERSKETYKKLFDAGARAALLRFETSNKDIFQKLRPNTRFEERIELIKYLKEKGYILATGFLTGLPGENEQDIINNILLTKSLKADMYSFGPLIPSKGTPLENQEVIKKDTMLKTIAITRLLDRNSNILVTTALETLDNCAKRQGLMAGANSLMINLTPKAYKDLYFIYQNKAGNDKPIKKNIKETLDLLYSLGRAPIDLGL